MMTQSVSVKTKRPFVVTFVSVWIFLAALLDLFYGALLFASTDIIEKPPDVRIAIQQERLANAMLDNQVTDAAEGLLYIALGVVQLVLGAGFLSLKRWAWVGIMSWQALSILVDLTSLLSGDQPVLSPPQQGEQAAARRLGREQRPKEAVAVVGAHEIQHVAVRSVGRAIGKAGHRG